MAESPIDWNRVRRLQAVSFRTGRINAEEQRYVQRAFDADRQRYAQQGAEVRQQVLGELRAIFHRGG